MAGERNSPPTSLANDCEPNTGAKQRLSNLDLDELVVETSRQIAANPLARLSAPPKSHEVKQQPPQSSSAPLNHLNQPKRPMNAFMVWSQAIRRELHRRYCNVQNASLSKALGRVWKLLDTEQKEPFVRRANQIKANHKRDYPNYRYQPRRLLERRPRANVLVGITLDHPVNSQPALTSKLAAVAAMRQVPMVGHGEPAGADESSTAASGSVSFADFGFQGHQYQPYSADQLLQHQQQQQQQHHLQQHFAAAAAAGKQQTAPLQLPVARLPNEGPPFVGLADDCNSCAPSADQVLHPVLSHATTSQGPVSNQRPSAIHVAAFALSYEAGNTVQRQHHHPQQQHRDAPDPAGSYLAEHHHRLIQQQQQQQPQPQLQLQPPPQPQHYHQHQQLQLQLPHQHQRLEQQPQIQQQQVETRYEPTTVNHHPAQLVQQKFLQSAPQSEAQQICEVGAGDNLARVLYTGAADTSFRQRQRQVTTDLATAASHQHQHHLHQNHHRHQGNQNML